MNPNILKPNSRSRVWRKSRRVRNPLPSFRQSIVQSRSKYSPHVGAKQTAKANA